ncbi:hypothetical protein AVEN_49181-1 [Araneus ventricosus]|uniref:Uncharacterized protein n=1 Tax=Araneus ventricosus TaxID=182803 RepID=A0A4Y2J443_ARAVE|nr:hypothetical protein AVEN_49181-1 [Araneus ventricosus]
MPDQLSRFETIFHEGFAGYVKSDVECRKSNLRGERFDVGGGVTDHVSFSSSDHASKLREQYQNQVRQERGQHGQNRWPKRESADPS